VIQRTKHINQKNAPLVANNDICLWSQLAELQTPPVITTDFVYVPFIGDKSIQEKDFGRIQIDREVIWLLVKKKGVSKVLAKYLALSKESCISPSQIIHYLNLSRSP
jgi:hypothetical protein